MSAFDWSSAPGVWPSLGPDIAKALRDIATMPIERLRKMPMTESEFEECVKRVYDVLPENALDAVTVLGAVCNGFIGEVDKRRPGVAMMWMGMLQSVFDKVGVET